MLRAYSVSEITKMLSGCLMKDSQLQDVWVQGRISLDHLQSVFFLLHKENKIRCFIPDGNINQYPSLLAAGNTVVVYGDLTLFPLFSEYQIRVKDIQRVGANAEGNNQLFTVSDITSRLEEITTSSSEIQQIHVRGEITNFELHSDQPWYLSDSSDSTPDSAAVSKLQQKIHCFFNPNSTTSVNKNDAVWVQGAIRIWGPSSRYQICVQQIGSDNQIAHCRCPGCAQCGGKNKCDRLREAANFEPCATCLPRPPDELYKLCPECYAVSSDHETEVTKAVYDYLAGLGVKGFFPSTESQIQFGTRNGIADVVLTDVNGSFAVIAECKGAGYVGYGVEQLKSYLSATDTRFGVFANRADLSQWKFYENRQRNCVPEIDRSDFEFGVVKNLNLRPLLQDEIANLRQEIHLKLDDLLEEKIQRLERPLSDLKIELQKRGIVNWFKNLFSKEKE